MAQKFTKKYKAQVWSNRALFEFIFPPEDVFFAIAVASCFIVNVIGRTEHDHLSQEQQ